MVHMQARKVVAADIKIFALTPRLAFLENKQVCFQLPQKKLTQCNTQNNNVVQVTKTLFAVTCMHVSTGCGCNLPHMPGPQCWLCWLS